MSLPQTVRSVRAPCTRHHMVCASWGDSSPCPHASRTHRRTSPHRYQHGIPTEGQGQSSPILPTLYSGTECGLSARHINGGSPGNRVKSPYTSIGGRHTPCASARPISPASRPCVTLTTMPPIPCCHTRHGWHHGTWPSHGSNNAAMIYAHRTHLTR